MPNKRKQKPQEPDLNFDSAINAAQGWIKENKVVTAVAVAAVLYLVGGKRVRSLLGMALRSGATAGLANAAIGAIIPNLAAKETTDDSLLH